MDSLDVSMYPFLYYIILKGILNLSKLLNFNNENIKTANNYNNNNNYTEIDDETEYITTEYVATFSYNDYCKYYELDEITRLEYTHLFNNCKLKNKNINHKKNDLSIIVYRDYNTFSDNISNTSNTINSYSIENVEIENEIVEIVEIENEEKEIVEIENVLKKDQDEYKNSDLEMFLIFEGYKDEANNYIKDNVEVDMEWVNLPLQYVEKSKPIKITKTPIVYKCITQEQKSNYIDHIMLTFNDNLSLDVIIKILYVMEYNYYRYNVLNLFKFKCLFLIIFNNLYKTESFQELFYKYFHVNMTKEVEEYIKTINEMNDLHNFITFYNIITDKKKNIDDKNIEFLDIIKKLNVLQDIDMITISLL